MLEDAFVDLDETLQTVTVSRYIEGHYDEHGTWVPGGDQTVATITYADIQPRSGEERAAESGTRYESDYVCFAWAGNVAFDEELDEDEKALRKGDDVEDEEGRRYRLVFPGYWRTHYEMTLESLDEKEENNND